MNVQELFSHDHITYDPFNKPKSPMDKEVVEPVKKAIRPARNVLVTFYKNHSSVCKIFLFLLYYAVGIIFMLNTSKHDWEPPGDTFGLIECVYFITVSSLTVGYGYFHPNTDGSKLFIIFYLVLGVTLIVYLCTDFARTVLQGAHDEIILHFRRIRGLPPPRPEDFGSYRSILSVLLVMLWCFVGTLFISSNEGWPVLDGLYWTVITMTTVGYGDLNPLMRSTRIFAIFYMYASCLTFAVAFANMVDEYTARVQRGQVRRTLQTLSTDHFGEKWVRDALQLTEGAAQSGTVGIEPEIGGLEQPACSRERFVLLTLIELGVLNHHQDVAPLLKKFSELDEGGLGRLGRIQLSEFQRQVAAISEAARYEDLHLHEVGAGAYRSVSPMNLRGVEFDAVDESKLSYKHVYDTNLHQDTVNPLHSGYDGDQVGATVGVDADIQYAMLPPI